MRVRQMISRGWFWGSFFVILTALFLATIRRAGVDRYGDWSFGRSISAAGEMFGGLWSLLGILGCIVVAFGAWYGMYHLSKKKHHVAVGIVAVVAFIAIGFIGLRWIRLEFGVLVTFGVGLALVFLTTFVVGLIFVNSKNYRPMPARRKTAPAPVTSYKD